MGLILGAIGLVLAFWYMRKRKAELSQTPDTSAALAGREKAWVWILCVLAPIASGAVFYYGWRKSFPARAAQANRISWFAFFIWFALAAIAGIPRLVK